MYFVCMAKALNLLFYATIHYDDINQNCASLTEMVATAFEVPFLRCQ